jgi:hypothetical protein
VDTVGTVPQMHGYRKRTTTFALFSKPGDILISFSTLHHDGIIERHSTPPRCSVSIPIHIDTEHRQGCRGSGIESSTKEKRDERKGTRDVVLFATVVAVFRRLVAPQ